MATEFFIFPQGWKEADIAEATGGLTKEEYFSGIALQAMLSQINFNNLIAINETVELAKSIGKLMVQNSPPLDTPI